MHFDRLAHVPRLLNASVCWQLSQAGLAGKCTALIEQQCMPTKLKAVSQQHIHSKYNEKLFSKILYERTDLTGRPKIGFPGFGTPNPKLGICKSCLQLMLLLFALNLQGLQYAKVGVCRSRPQLANWVREYRGTLCLKATPIQTGQLSVRAHGTMCLIATSILEFLRIHDMLIVIMQTFNTK